MPEATPAEAPHSALTEPSGRFATLTARFAMGALQALCLVGIDMSRGWTGRADGAYRSGTFVGDGGSGSCVDMGGTACADSLEPVYGRG